MAINATKPIGTNLSLLWGSRTNIDKANRIIARLPYLLALIAAATTGQGLATQSQSAPMIRADPNFALKLAALFDRLPDPASCQAGELSTSARAEALGTVNAIRAYHHLPPVEYDRSADGEVMAASLVMAAQGDLSHWPLPSWRCYSEAAAKGAGSSNLSGGVVSPHLRFDTPREDVVDWVTDVRNVVGGTGHRRWILSPFVTRIAYGRTGWETPDGLRTEASALKIFDFASEKPVAGPLPDFVAYPFDEYPIDLFDPKALLSFSPVVDKLNKWNNLQADLTNVKVTVSTGGETLHTSVFAKRIDAIGYTPTIEFTADNIQPDVTYRVDIEGVVYQGRTIDYHYDFRLVGRRES